MLRWILISAGVGMAIGAILDGLERFEGWRLNRPMTWYTITPEGPVERHGTRAEYYRGATVLGEHGHHAHITPPEDDAPPAVWGGEDY